MLKQKDLSRLRRGILLSRSAEVILSRKLVVKVCSEFFVASSLCDAPMSPVNYFKPSFFYWKRIHDASHCRRAKRRDRKTSFSQQRRKQLSARKCFCVKKDTFMRISTFIRWFWFSEEKSAQRSFQFSRISFLQCRIFAQSEKQKASKSLEVSSAIINLILIAIGKELLRGTWKVAITSSLCQERRAKFGFYVNIFIPEEKHCFINVGSRCELCTYTYSYQNNSAIKR